MAFKNLLRIFAYIKETKTTMPKYISYKDDIETIKKRMGERDFGNLSDIYQRLRASKEVDETFRQDYLLKEDMDSSFVCDFLRNEAETDLSEKMSEGEFDDLVDRINSGYGEFRGM